jgi:hypothetical protein
MTRLPGSGRPGACRALLDAASTAARPGVGTRTAAVHPFALLPSLGCERHPLLGPAAMRRTSLQRRCIPTPSFALLPLHRVAGVGTGSQAEAAAPIPAPQGLSGPLTPGPYPPRLPGTSKRRPPQLDAPLLPHPSFAISTRLTCPSSAAAARLTPTQHSRAVHPGPPRTPAAIQTAPMASRYLRERLTLRPH